MYTQFDTTNPYGFAQSTANPVTSLSISAQAAVSAGFVSAAQAILLSSMGATPADWSAINSGTYGFEDVMAQLETRGAPAAPAPANAQVQAVVGVPPAAVASVDDWIHQNGFDVVMWALGFALVGALARKFL